MQRQYTSRVEVIEREENDRVGPALENAVSRHEGLIIRSGVRDGLQKISSMFRVGVLIFWIHRLHSVDRKCDFPQGTKWKSIGSPLGQGQPASQIT